jgi:hypothetical protein
LTYVTILPITAIHHRNSGDNLLVVKVKKPVAFQNNVEGDDFDRVSLRAFQGPIALQVCVIREVSD